MKGALVPENVLIEKQGADYDAFVNENKLSAGVYGKYTVNGKAGELSLNAGAKVAYRTNFAPDTEVLIDGGKQHLVAEVCDKTYKLPGYVDLPVMDIGPHARYNKLGVEVAAGVNYNIAKTPISVGADISYDTLNKTTSGGVKVAYTIPTKHR